MRNKRTNDLLTPRCGAKFGVRVLQGQEPVALIKQGRKVDTLSIREFAVALYGPGTRCEVIPGRRAQEAR